MREEANSWIEFLQLKACGVWVIRWVMIHIDCYSDFSYS